jgi:hypothetical protein
MAVAMIYPEPEKTGRGEKFSLGEDLSSCRLSMARSVLKSASRVRNLSTTPMTKSACATAPPPMSWRGFVPDRPLPRRAVAPPVRVRALGRGPTGRRWNASTVATLPDDPSRHQADAIPGAVAVGALPPMSKSWAGQRAAIVRVAAVDARKHAPPVADPAASGGATASVVCAKCVHLDMMH